MYVKMEEKMVRKSMSHSQVPMSIFDHLQQPALALDCEGRVIVWNTSMEQYTGNSADEIVGKGD